MVVHFDKEGTSAALFCIMLAAATYSEIFPLLSLFATSLALVWSFNFVLKAFHIPGTWKSKADALFLFQLEEIYHILPIVSETLDIIPEASRIILILPTILFYQAIFKPPFFMQAKNINMFKISWVSAHLK